MRAREGDRGCTRREASVTEQVLDDRSTSVQADVARLPGRDVVRPAACLLTRATLVVDTTWCGSRASKQSTRSRRRRRADIEDTRIDRHADLTPFRHSFSSNSTNLSLNITQYHTSRQNFQNRPHTARSTMVPISRGGRSTLDDGPKKIAVPCTVSQSHSHVAIMFRRSRPTPASGKAGLLISVDRPRWSRARGSGVSHADPV